MCREAAGQAACVVLSEFTASASLLKPGPLLVNPYDVDQTCEALVEAINLPSEKLWSGHRQMFRWVPCALSCVPRVAYRVSWPPCSLSGALCDVYGMCLVNVTIASTQLTCVTWHGWACDQLCDITHQHVVVSIVPGAPSQPAVAQWSSNAVPHTPFGHFAHCVCV